MKPWQNIRNYWRLTKPRIWGLLVFTGMIAMLVGYRETGVPFNTQAFVIVAVSLVLGSASADVLTNYHDRDIDGIMRRTQKRPIPSGDVSPKSALTFGLSMAVLSVLVPLLLINALSAGFMLLGLLDNVVVYSLILKRRSWLNIILGGISGGMPVLVGYSAVAATVSPVAIYMSALVIVWIPTHIWSLAIFSKADYEAAKVPMLPVVFGEDVASVCVALTSALLAVFSVALIFLRPNIYYAVSATLLGAVVLAYSAKLAVDKKRETAWTLFKITSPYLTAIFLVLGATLWY
ncbi:MAG: protoheme IX farnesyltransferase [archaeon]|nr:MAG: protoheme IX farnesyltransferase [archaeon]